MIIEPYILIPLSLYDDIVDYFDNIADASGDSQGYTTNREMKISSRLQNDAKREPADKILLYEKTLKEIAKMQPIYAGSAPSIAKEALKH